MTSRLACATLLLAVACASGSGAPATASSTATQAAPRITTQITGATGTIFAVHAVSANVVWAAGTGGTVLRTRDGGATWEKRPVMGGERLGFRDVHALNADSAWVLSIGNGDQSRIYFTANGGATWALQFRNTDSSAFYDCITMLTPKIGVVFGDASQGRTMVLRTENGGATWALLPQANVPAPVKGEGAYAASGRCIVSAGAKHAWIATGGPESRLFTSDDAGLHWALHTTPFVHTASAGTSGLDFRDAKHGIGVAGDMTNLKGDSAKAVVAVTDDGGKTWELRTRPGLPGALTGVTWVPGAGKETAVAAGFGGVFYTTNGGRTWTTASDAGFAGVDAFGRSAWVGSTKGNMLRLDW